MIDLSLYKDLDPKLKKLFDEIGHRAINGNIQPLFVDNQNRRIGIGTVNPLERLHIDGNVLIRNGRLTVTALAVLDFLHARNIDVPGLISASRLGVTERAFLRNLDVFGEVNITRDINIGPTTHLLVEDTTRGRYQNGWTVIASSSPSVSSSVTFTIPTLSGAMYWLMLRNLRNPSDELDVALRFNEDSGANYKRAAWVFKSNDTTSVSGANATTAIALSLSDRIGIAQQFSADVYFEPLITSDTDQVSVRYHSSYVGVSPSNLLGITGSGYYDGTADISSVSVVAIAGLMTGSIYLLRMLPTAGR